MKTLTDFINRGLMAVITLVITFSAGARTISGIVVDENDEPLAGATVREIPLSSDNSVAMVITDLNGHFSLTVPQTATEIEAYFLGYLTKKVKLTSTDSYRIALQPNDEMLDEVVVTGY